MEIEEARRIKKETETKILKLLSEFESITKLEVNSVSLAHIQPVVMPRFVSGVELECLVK